MDAKKRITSALNFSNGLRFHSLKLLGKRKVHFSIYEPSENWAYHHGRLAISAGEAHLVLKHPIMIIQL